MSAVLALDTSSPAGGVALLRGGAISSAGLPDAGRQASDLAGAVEALLAAAELTAGDLSAVLVGEGPGSFTGVRVGAATAKGLAHALGLPLLAVPSLASAAVADVSEEAGPPGPETRYVLFDARADRVYGACYRVSAVGVDELVAPHGGTVEEALGSEPPRDAVFCGEGATRHRELIGAAGFSVAGPPAGLPTAQALLRYLRLHPDLEPVPDPATWEPRYVRASNAEREWGG